MSKRIFWTESERTKLINYCAAALVDRKIELKWQLPRIFGLSGIIDEAQKAVLDKTRYRTHVPPLVTEFKADIRKRMLELKNGHAKENDARITVSPIAAPEPEIPNRMGLDPKIAESLAYLLQMGVKTLAEEIANGVGAQLRDAFRDMRYRIAPLAPAAPATQETPYKPASELPEKFRRPKVGILTLHADQQQILMRQFPEMDFRFIDPHSKQISEISSHCERTFIMTKFIGHKHQSQIRGAFSMVNGGMTELARAVQINYPKTRYTGIAKAA